VNKEKVLELLKYTILLSVIIYSSYNVGKKNREIQLLEATSVCTSDVLNEVDRSGGITEYYGHKGTSGNTWNHAQALVNHYWSECFRKELFK
jgi:hypothetical protein